MQSYRRLLNKWVALVNCFIWRTANNCLEKQKRLWSFMARPFPNRASNKKIKSFLWILLFNCASLLKIWDFSIFYFQWITSGKNRNNNVIKIQMQNTKTVKLFACNWNAYSYVKLFYHRFKLIHLNGINWWF